jgi:hypothetical protein
MRHVKSFATEPPLEYVQGMLRLVPQSFWAVIQSKGEASSSSSSSSGPETTGCCQADPYGWQEIQPVGDGTWELLEGGRAGTPDLNPGYELNGNCIEVGSIVRIRPGYESEFLFDQCCSVCRLANRRLAFLQASKARLVRQRLAQRVRTRPARRVRTRPA